MGSLFGGSSDRERAGEQKITDLTDQQQALGKRIGQGAGKDLKFAEKKALKPALNFFRTLLSGDRGAITELLSPELRQVRDNEQQQLNSIAQFGPRGGGMASAVNNVQNQTRGQIADLFQKTRPGAATALEGIASEYANIGLGRYGLEQQGLNSSLGGLEFLNEMERRRQEQKGAGIGSLIGGALGIGSRFIKPRF